MERLGLVKRRGDEVVLVDPDLVEGLLLRFEPTPDLPSGVPPAVG